ncbi:MAG: hypothetical protein UY18_C0048G0004 [Microgenomates group bacterium GW2011_GWF2_47_9]|nr:MAG: hypothetical protein UY18_C0048G0004 [Microgenomates group bacterium GW2011_GWF2_47_9]
MAKDQLAMKKQVLQPHQIWHVARKYIGIGPLSKMFGVSSRTIYDYAADPAFVTEKGCRDPLERMHDLLRMLDDNGFGQYAKAALEYLETAVFGGSCRDRVQEPRESLTEEQLLDYGSVAEMHRAIESGRSLEEVKKLKRAAIEEIERTYLRYSKDQEQL